MASSFPTRDSNGVPDVSVIIVNYNTAHLLPRTLAALEAGCGQLRLQVIVVDNASRDQSVEFLRKEFPNVELIVNPNNIGFGRANNLAVSRTRGRYVLLLNVDAFVSPDTLPKSVGFLDDHPRSGVLGVRLVDENGRVQPSCFYFPTPWSVFLEAIGLDRLVGRGASVEQSGCSLHECDWVRGCYFMIRHEVIEALGLFDPRYFLYFEEVDYCRSLRDSGWGVTYYPYTTVTHIGGESAKFDGRVLDSMRQISALHDESQLLYFRKHHGVSGILASAFLSTLTDVARVVKRLIVLPDDLDRGRAAMDHCWLVIRLLVATRIGSRPIH
jgi:N-acetylglucosaminyl-diphospho-decaprenol L-rhamnosyltransferase